MQSPEDRWAAAARDLPATPDAFLQAIAAFTARGAHKTAEAGLVAAFARFPGNIGVAARFARAAERRHDWPEAVARWQEVRHRFPANRGAVQALAAACVRSGQAEQAEALLDTALRDLRGGDLAATDPTVRGLMMEHAKVAAHRGDYAVARQRWHDLLRQLPDDPAVQAGWRDTEVQAALGAGDDGPMPMPPAGQPAPHADLMLRFEGLGGTCEFGLVQRHFGVEPLGLFRWVSLSAVNLCAALGSELAGIGDPRFTRLTVTAAGEFATSDTRYGLGMHTFMRNTGQDQEKLAAQLQRRMRFLRDKLLEDLRAGEKIFVYRHVHAPADAALLPLLAVVRAYNPANRLLVVRMLPHGSEGEAPRPFAEGAMTAAIANGRQPSGGWAIDFGRWLRTCVAVGGET